jgi:two-component system chemotaxis response regulator CheY
MSNVLAIDDSPISRRIYESVLNQHCNIDLTCDAEEAWQAFTNSHYDLVITDVNLPGMSGLELLAKIRSKQSNNTVPIIVVSADADSIEDAKTLGSCFWLLKPIDPESLLKAVKQILKIPIT